jgi:hypothetical protein
MPLSKDTDFASSDGKAGSGQKMSKTKAIMSNGSEQYTVILCLSITTNSGYQNQGILESLYYFQLGVQSLDRNE